MDVRDTLGEEETNPSENANEAVDTSPGSSSSRIDLYRRNFAPFTTNVGKDL